MLRAKLSCIVLYCLVLSYLVLPCLVLSGLVLYYLVLSYLILSYLVLSFLFLSFLTLSYLVLPCHVLSCLWSKECYKNAFVYDGLVKVDNKIKHHIINVFAKDLTDMSASIAKKELKTLR